MSSSAKVQWKFPGPKGDPSHGFWQTSPFSPPTCQTPTRCSSGSQASHVCGEISPPRGSGGSQRGLSHLLRESSSFDDVGWIKTHRSQLRIIKQQTNQTTYWKMTNRFGPGHGNQTQTDFNQQQIRQRILVSTWQSAPDRRNKSSSVSALVLVSSRPSVYVQQSLM